jgi:glycosyltransferase involved in cell wall biosynthesis
VTLSVCIPAYNAERFLAAAVESVLSQDFTDYELIIVDNASTDRTPEIIAGFTDPRIRSFRNASNVGALENHNVCLGHARGSYVQFLCADDVLLPRILGEKVRVLETEPKIGVVVHNITVTDETLTPQYDKPHYPGRAVGSEVARVSVERIENWIGGPSDVMFRRELANRIRFNPRFVWWGDFLFYAELLTRSGCDYFNVDRVGSLYRLHPQSDTELSCHREVRAERIFAMLRERKAFNALNCAKLICRPVGWKRRAYLLGWLVLRPWSIFSAVRMMFTPVANMPSVGQRAVSKLQALYVRRMQNQ